MRKKLMLMVSNSVLVLNRSSFKKQSRSMFNPCFNKAAKTMLYMRYEFKGLEKILLYDFSKEILTIPHDVL